MYYLKGDVITSGKIIENQFIEIKNNKITSVDNQKRCEKYPVYSAKDGYIVPGFVDIHIHGIDGFDFMDDHKKKFTYISRALLKYGVTSYVATSRTEKLFVINDFLKSAKLHQQCQDKSSRFLGVHLEGPWIHPKYAGAQPRENIRELTELDIDEIISPYQKLIRKVTLAPELIKDIRLLEKIYLKNIKISAGHTNSTIEEIEEAMQYGLDQLTHMFNAMSPFHHRDLGAVAAGMYYDDLYCEVIADGLHVDRRVIELLYKHKGKERIVFISDCTGYNLYNNGKFKERNRVLIKKGKKIMLENGSLAGSTYTLSDVLKFAVNHCNIPVQDVIYMMTETPLRAIGEKANIGKIKPGYLADIVILDKSLDVKETIVNGETVFKRAYSD